MSIDELRNVAGLDVDTGLTNCMNDEELYLQVVDMFQMQLTDDINTIKKYYDAGDWENLGKISHGVKGAAASIGAIEIQNLAAKIEIAGKASNEDLIREHFESFLDLIVNTQSDLTN